MTQVVTVHMADPVGVYDEVRPAEIRVAMYQEGAPGPVNFRAEAERIADALHDSLPGGTLTALTGLLLERQADHLLRVRLP